MRLLKVGFMDLLITMLCGVVCCCSVRKEADVKEGVQDLKQMEPGSEIERRKTAAVHLQRAQVFLKEGNVTDAQKEALAALALDANHPVPHLVMGDVHFEKEEYENALKEYQRAKEFDQTKSLPYVKIGYVYAQLGKYEQAEESFKTALALEPNAKGMHLDLGNLYKEMKLTEAAEREYGSARAVEGRRVEASKKEQQTQVTGRKLYSERLDPQVVKILELGDEFSRRGIASEAIKQYRLAVELKPGSLVTHQKLGDAYSRKGMLAEAIKEYEKVVKLNPESALGFLGLGVVYGRMYELDKSTYFLEKGLSLDPNSVPLELELAKVLEKSDRLEEAIVLQEKAIAHPPPRIPGAEQALNRMKDEWNAERGFVTFENDHFYLKYDPDLSKEFIDYVVKSLSEARLKLIEDLSFTPHEKIVVKLYAELKEFQTATGTPQWFRGGVAATRDFKILLATPKLEQNIRKLPEVICHELTHVFTNLMTYGNHPTWLHEGLALYEANQWSLQNKELLASALSSNQLLRLSELRFPFVEMKSQAEINLAYAESYSAVEYLIEKYGREELKKLLSAFAEGKDFREAALNVLGVEVEAFERGWEKAIREKYDRNRLG
jgi:tetratricopeptide (TPR) repeat protein